MKLLTKPIYIRLCVSTVLVLLLILALLITGIVLYNNHVFHNLFFQNLSEEDVETVFVYSRYGQDLAQLTQEETEAVITLLRNIRLQEEPYKDVKLLGGFGNGYHIRLKNGIAFDLKPSGGDPGLYIFGEWAYSIGKRDDPESAAAYENLWRMEELYRAHMKKYYP